MQLPPESSQFTTSVPLTAWSEARRVQLQNEVLPLLRKAATALDDLARDENEYARAKAAALSVGPPSPQAQDAFTEHEASLARSRIDAERLYAAIRGEVSTFTNYSANGVREVIDALSRGSQGLAGLSGLGSVTGVLLVTGLIVAGLAAAAYGINSIINSLTRDHVFRTGNIDTIHQFVGLESRSSLFGIGGILGDASSLLKWAIIGGLLFLAVDWISGSGILKKIGGHKDEASQ